MIAGPILRGSEFLPQLARGGIFERERTRRGIWLIASGVLKKVIIADFLLAPIVDEVFAYPGVSSAPVHLIALYSFAFQIYFDFSGYTDIARGIACLLGFELPLNFREPYLSRNPAEFWRRWHITLSSWLRDYLYITLGGNRKGPLRNYANLMITMLLGGLWHGAGWNFVIWGGLHGFLLVSHKFAGALGLRRRDPESKLSLRDVPSIVLNFHAVCFIWIFFRATTFADALQFMDGLFSLDYTASWPVLPLAVVLLCGGLHAVERTARLRAASLRASLEGGWGGVLEGAALGVIAALAVAAAGAGGEFIYFQF